MAKRLLPLLNRVLVEKIVPQSKTSSGILLPERTSKEDWLVILAGDFISKHLGRCPGSKAAVALSRIFANTSRL